MNHFPPLVASCAYGHHLAKEAIAPDWRAGRGNVRLSAIFSWTIGSCCSCDITLTHTSSQGIVGDHFQTDIMVFASGLKTGTARVDSSSFCRVGYLLVAYTGAYNMHIPQCTFSNIVKRLLLFESTTFLTIKIKHTTHYNAFSLKLLWIVCLFVCIRMHWLKFAVFNIHCADCYLWAKLPHRGSEALVAYLAGCLCPVSRTNSIYMFKVALWTF